MVVVVVVVRREGKGVVSGDCCRRFVGRKDWMRGTRLRRVGRLLWVRFLGLGITLLWLLSRRW